MNKNQFITVVGFSRSGTSLISHILAEVLGINFGEAVEHIPKNAENPDGFYENQQIMDFNESVLSRSNASVINLPATDFLQQLPAGELDALVIKAKNLLAIAANNRPAFGFKDPRLCLTLPIWRLAAEKLKTVIIVRNPWGALQSFSAQMQRPLHELEPLWFEYQHRILLNTAGADRFMLSFERLLSHPLETITALADYLGIKPNAAHWAKQLDTIIKPGRVAHLKPAEPFEFSPHFQPKTKLAYAQLNNYLGVGAQPDYAAIGALFQGLRGYEAAHVQPLTSQIAKLDGELREQINHVITRDLALVEHAQFIRDRDSRIAQLEMQLQEHSQQLGQHIKMVQARDSQINELTARNTAHDSALVDHANLLDDRDSRIALLEMQLQEHSQQLGQHIKMVQARDVTLANAEKIAFDLKLFQADATSKITALEEAISTSEVLRDALSTQLAQLRGLLQVAQQNEAVASADAAKLKQQLHTLKSERTAQIEGQQHLEREVIALAMTVDELKTESREYLRQREELHANHRLAVDQLQATHQSAMQQEKSALHHAMQEELACAQTQITETKNLLQLAQQHTITQERSLAVVTNIARKKDALLVAQQGSSAQRLKHLISPPNDLWNLVSPIYASFKTEPQTSLSRQRGFGLYVAQSIAENDATVYELIPEVRSISEIQFILDDDIRVTGELYFELLSPTHIVLVQSKLALNDVGIDGIARFQFSATSLEGNTSERFTIRLFTKQATDPVRLYEMQQRSRINQLINARAAFMLATSK